MARWDSLFLTYILEHISPQLSYYLGTVLRRAYKGDSFLVLCCMTLMMYFSNYPFYAILELMLDLDE